MASQEHLDILTQEVEIWNQWRREQPATLQLDLSRADLTEADLSGADLRKADLSWVKLRRADLRNADLSDALLIGASLADAHLGGADLRRAKLHGAELSGAFLRGAQLKGADLTATGLNRAHLERVDLSGVDLRGANLTGARLRSANFTGANLGGVALGRADLSRAKLAEADLSKARFMWTTFADVDLSEVKGLDTTRHLGPSSIGVDTIYRSEGKISEQFLRGCGLSDWQIEMSKLHQAKLGKDETKTILDRIYDLLVHPTPWSKPIFISYSHADSQFVDAMEKSLNEKGIRSWRDIHHATAGPLERQIEHAIEQNPTVLLILSVHSVKSDWVQHEVRLARRLEIETHRSVLCPLALDNTWKQTPSWPKRILEQIMEYQILDFSGWKDEENFRRMIGRLLDGLMSFYE